ncbi:MAG: hypothetical protein J6D47_03105 [Peptostreptococcaceae bacterium]|nr:hypothetical protein [Peptostreptococcaceae bacterium]
MSVFFTESDFKAFEVRKAMLEDTKTIADRKIVVEKMRDLHKCGIGNFMKSKGLNPHWREKTNLTNVIWPLKQANGGSVTYLRLGYGKSKEQIDNLSKYLKLYSFNDRGYLKDDMAFHYITQIQIALDESEWNTSLYLGKHGWLEQNNIVNKIKAENNKNKFIELLDDIIDNGYILRLYLEEETIEYKNSKAFINDMTRYTNDGITYTIHIINSREKLDDNNEIKKIIPFIKSEFGKLLDLYYFMSWSENNNYI